MTTTSKPARGFGLENDSTPTRVEVAECSDGAMYIALITKRDEMPELKTAFKVSSATFALLAEALARAAHDNTVWHDSPEDGTSKP